MPCVFRPVGHSPTDCVDAEAYAQSLSNPSLHDLCLLLDKLPSEAPPRGSADSHTKCWTTGAFSKDSVVGRRRNLRSGPHVTKVLCAFLRRVAPGFPFSAIAVFRNQLALPHQDVNNNSSVANVIVPLTSFQEGGIWIQSHSGLDIQDMTTWVAAA